MGGVEHRQGPADPQFPPSLEVQDLPKHTQRRLAAEGPVHDADETDLTGIEKVRRFPHGLKKKNARGRCSRGGRGPRGRNHGAESCPDAAGGGYPSAKLAPPPSRGNTGPKRPA